MTTRHCTRCHKSTSDYVAIDLRGRLVFVCAEHVAALVPVGTRYVTVTPGGAR